jgi:TetR/AcrR family transcriptional regulator
MAKPPGRPARQQTANAATSIVEAACLYFSRHGIRGTSYRQIADAAGVTPAMVHYYFPDKAALHLAVLQATFQSLIRKLADTEDLEQWVHCFHSHVMTHPWCPQLMLREVLPAGGELRELFLQHFAPQVFGSVKAMVRQAFRAAKVPRRLDLDRHVVLLLAMLVYPFLGMEVAQTVTGRSFDTRMMQRFRDDALALFRTGISER